MFVPQKKHNPEKQNNMNTITLLDIDLTKEIQDFALNYGPKVIGAVLVLFIGLWLSKTISNYVVKISSKRGLDKSLQGFFKSLIGGLLKTLVVLSALGMLGIEMTSFVAILGAAGLAVGMALSGTLQNFAGGVMILIFKPFKVGDVIDAQGYLGSVSEIQIFNTILKTPDNKTIIIPNAGLSSGSMINYSTEATRRVDFTFGIDYGDDIDQAKSLLKDLFSADSRVLKDQDLFIAVGELGDSSVNIIVRAWAKSEDYWGLHFDMTELVKKEFDKAKISFPYPQQDIHIITAPESK